MKRQTLDVKELIHIGIFTAIYFMVIAIPGILGIIPIFMLLLPAMIGFLGAIPIMLLIAKTQKFGALTILCLIINILLIIGGHPWIALIYSILVTVIADYIMARGHYQNTKLNALGYIIFSMWSIGNLLPFYFMRQTFLAHLAERHGSHYEQTVAMLFSYQMIPVLIILTIIGAWLGYIIATTVLRKHFKRAGMI